MGLGEGVGQIEAIGEAVGPLQELGNEFFWWKF